MESSNDSDKPTTSDFIMRSSSRHSITSYHSKSSGSGSVKPVKFGSRRSDSEGLGLSQKEISGETSDFIMRSSSRHSITSYHSKSSGSGSVKPLKFGSRRSDSEGLGLSQKEISDEDARFIYINDPAKTNEKHEFASNSIRTSKYSILTFLPRNLYEQFHRVAYIYFLIIAVLNQLPQLEVFAGPVSILPLAFVLLVSAVKDGYEDFRRHQADRVENNRLASVLVNGSFQPKKWKHIQVGEIIKVSSNETLPCDIVLLSTSDPTGVVYVQTINLDGESNLKTRYAKQETLLKNPEVENLSGVIKCEKPNRNIYGFLANTEIEGKRISLGPTNIILRGCELKNTSWAIGVVVYAGPETKAMLNSSGAPSKRSLLETQMNREIILLSLFLVAMCTIVSTLFGIWIVRHKDRLDNLQFYRKKTYAEPRENDDYNYHGWGLEIFFTFLMCVIVFQTMIPISLYISMELVRVGQVYFMIQDKNMYDEASKSSFQCRALNINEDLGQIGYVFSDKTGTLTENKMEFRCASIWGVDYSHEDASEPDELDSFSIEVDGKVWRPKMKVKVDAELQRLAKIGMDEEAHIYDFFLALAACNTIVPIVTDSTEPTVKILDYQGESPDEQALVYAAAAYGFALVERTSGHIVVDIQGERQRFDVLGLHEFDSDRKRMSVILGCPDHSVKLFVKGADTNMLNVIEKSLNLDVIERTESHLHKYASCGLRTLVVGMRELNASEYQQWQSSYESANAALIGRATRLRQLAARVETKLTILGSTAIEDKLQKGVPEAIESLRKAGIKVWVLTGDKQETAISIGYSSKLLTGDMTQVIINGKTMDSCRRYLKEALASLKNRRSRSSNALIIDGTSLVYILDSELEEELFEVASYCAVVLCCRTAPLQKAGVVSLIKNSTDAMTLAIGDGANDVSMIQQADVGVGISGQEGRQAVMASDFAMGQFRFLVPLLLVHGHWNYQRMAYMLLYNFYRNAVFVLVLFWYALFTAFTLTTAISDWSSVLYALFTAFTLTTAISDWSSVLYSVIYTSLPTIVVGILDKDLNRRTLLNHTRLYGPGQRLECYNLRLFGLTMIDTLWQSVAIFFIPLFAYWKTDIDEAGLGDLWTIAVVVTVNLHLAMDVVCWNWIVHLAIWGSIMATIICVIIIDSVPNLPSYWAIFNVAFVNNRLVGSFWLCLLAILIVSLMPRFVVLVFRQYLCPSDVQLAREAEKSGRLRNWENGEIEMSQF